MAKNKPKERMIKTSIDLTSDQYQYLKIKALDRKMKGQDPSFVTILRELIEEERKKWQAKPKLLILIILGLLCLTFSLPAFASYIPFNTNIKMNVGIGSSAPGQMLDVQGTVRSIGAIINTNVGIGTSFVSGTGEGQLVVMPGSGGNGNVGIGTWVPNATLVANGTIALGNGWLGNSNHTVDISGTGTLTPLTVEGGDGGIEFWKDTTPSDAIAFGMATPGKAIGNDFVISTYNGSSWVENLRLLNNSGNVGIGSTNPGTQLDVQGTVRMVGLTLTTGAQSGDVMVGSSVGVGTWMPVSTLGGGGTPGGSASQLQYDNAGAFGGITNSNVTASGNVGLGTTLSANFLDVRGNVGIGTAYAGYDSAAANGLIVQNNVGIGTYVPSALLEVGNQKMDILSSGNVGIGSAVPGQLLDVKGTVRDIGEIVNGNVGIGTSALQAAFAVTNGNVGIGTWTAGGGNLIVNGGGNVGIGSAWPGQALDVQGTVRTFDTVYDEEVIANATSITPSGSYKITYQNNSESAGTLTINNPTNTPVEGKSWILKIKSSAVQTFSWGSDYDGGTFGLPTSTLGTSTIQYYTFIWDSTAGKYDYTGNAGGF